MAIASEINGNLNMCLAACSGEQQVKQNSTLLPICLGNPLTSVGLGLGLLKIANLSLQPCLPGVDKFIPVQVMPYCWYR